MPCLHTQTLSPILFYGLERTTEAANCTILERKQRPAAAVSFEMPANRKDNGINQEVESEEECFV
jgi:hypothetical protein